MRACVRVFGNKTRRRREETSWIGYQFVFCVLRYQLEDDGLLKLGDPKVCASLETVEEETRGTASRRQKRTAATQQHKGARGTYAESETESEEPR